MVNKISKYSSEFSVTSVRPAHIIVAETLPASAAPRLKRKTTFYFLLFAEFSLL